VTDDRTGRELTPRPTEPEGVVTPREPVFPETPIEPDRFSAGEQAHTVGLTEERAAEIVKQSSNARTIAFLFVLLFVLFIPLYWLYDIGMPVIGVEGRLPQEGDQQYVTDVSRGYALYLANCARCHDSPGGAPGNGQGNVGPPLNDQAKLFNTLTEAGLPGPGHLNPDYLHSVLREGGRYVCGDPKSVMPAWLEPKGPLNYREVEELIDFILASKDTQIIYQPAHVEGGGTIPPPVEVEGWRDPAYTPAPGATPVPECWRGAPAGGGGGGGATAAPVESPGTAENPRVVEVHAKGVKWVDPNGQPLGAISVVQGETVEFHVVNEDGFGHNFHIGAATQLSSAPEHPDLPGVDTFPSGTQTFAYTVDALPEQPQFACTVPGHYSSMNGALTVIDAGGASSSAQPTLGPGGASPGSSIPPGASPQGSGVPLINPPFSAAPQAP
jgi:mono/diheme cytochrome c family protein